MTERDMMHGRDYAGQNVAGWLMAEKLNGCRAYWDGSTMWSRGGLIISIPDTMRAALPSGRHLDGEIYDLNGSFIDAMVAVKHGRFTPHITFAVFDAPDISGPFSVRYSHIAKNLPQAGVVWTIPHYVCDSYTTALEFMNRIQADGGEGVVLRDPANVYEARRCLDILKLKEAWDGGHHVHY